jgi:predicted RNA-binding Zn ribbon-like protein
VARRQLTPIERLPLVGGAPCLDLVNTTGNRGGVPRERLIDPADAAVFGRRAGLLAPREARELARSPQGGAALAALLELREALYRIFRAHLARRAPAQADLELLNAAYGEAARHRALAWEPRGSAFRLAPEPAGAGGLRRAIALSAVELLFSDELQRLAQCGECDWLFLDHSKNRSRRWCKKACGDRVKARAYYRRKKARGAA